MKPLTDDQLGQIKALLADHGLTVSRKRGTKSPAKRKRVKRVSGYRGPTVASLRKGVVSTAAKASERCSWKWSGSVPLDCGAYRKAHAGANQWLRMHAEKYGVTFKSH